MRGLTMAKSWEDTPEWVLGMRQRQRRKRREDKAREMSKRGVSDQKIAESLDVTVPTVRKYLGRVKGESDDQRPMW